MIDDLRLWRRRLEAVGFKLRPKIYYRLIGDRRPIGRAEALAWIATNKHHLTVQKWMRRSRLLTTPTQSLFVWYVR